MRHHARQFGKSKYGLSRIYKVLLDLMVIKTVASFMARPLLWFGMLSLPDAGRGSAGVRLDDSLQFATGTCRCRSPACGVIFLTSAFMLFAAGALGELVYKLGDLREHEFSGLTERLARAAYAPPAHPVSCHP